MFIYLVSYQQVGRIGWTLKLAVVIFFIFDVTNLSIHHNILEVLCQTVEITNQGAFITMSNQSNYAYEIFWGDIKGSFKNKIKA